MASLSITKHPHATRAGMPQISKERMNENIRNEATFHNVSPFVGTKITINTHRIAVKVLKIHRRVYKVPK